MERPSAGTYPQKKRDKIALLDLGTWEYLDPEIQKFCPGYKGSHCLKKPTWRINFTFFKWWLPLDLFFNCAEEKAGEDTSKPADASSNDMRAMDWERGTIDEANDAITEDLGNAVPHDHLVHPVLLLLQDDHHRPGVEGEGEDKDGKGNPKIEEIRDLRKISVGFQLLQEFLMWFSVTLMEVDS